MKTYQQMAFEVLKARDEHLLKRKKQKALSRIYIPVAASFSFSVLIGLHFWQQELPKVQHVPEVNTETTGTKQKSLLEFPAGMEFSDQMMLVTETGGSSESVTEVTAAEAIPEAEETKAFVPEVQETTPAVPEVQETKPAVPEVQETKPTVPEVQETKPTVPEVQETKPTVPEVQATEPPVAEMPAEANSATEFIPEQETSEMLPEETEMRTPVLNQIMLHLSQGTDEETIFNSTGYTISEGHVSEWFDTVDVTISYPDGTEQMIEHIGDAYYIQGVLPEQMAAVQFSGDETYYLFISAELSEEEFRRILEESGILE